MLMVEQLSWVQSCCHVLLHEKKHQINSQKLITRMLGN